MGPSSWMGPSSSLVRLHRQVVIFPKKAASVWRLFCATLSWLSPHAKAAKVSLNGSPLRLRGGVLRRAVSNVAVLPCHGTHGLNEMLVGCRCVGPTIPIALDVSPAMMLIKPALLSYR